MEMAIGKTEMYIMIMYDTWMAGCSSAILTTPNPAVLVDTAWKRPSRTRMPAGIAVMTGSFN
jgi:hypothetical protein